MLHFDVDSDPAKVVFQDPVSNKVLREIELDDISSFGRMTKFDQVWLQLSELTADGAEKLSRVCFECSTMAPLLTTLQGHAERASGVPFEQQVTSRAQVKI